MRALDRITLTSLIYSLVIHLLFWGIFYPAIFVSYQQPLLTRMVYIGSIGLERGWQWTTDRLPAGFLSRIVPSRFLRLSIFRRRYEDSIAERIVQSLEPVEAFRADYLTPGSVASMKEGQKGIRRIFQAGKLSHFPDGKAYHFVPEHLHYNVYLQMLLVREVERDYE